MAPVESTTCSRLPSPSRARQEVNFAGQGECSDYGLDEAVNRLLPYSYNARLLIFLCAPLCAPGYHQGHPRTPTDTVEILSLAEEGSWYRSVLYRPVAAGQLDIQWVRPCSVRLRHCVAGTGATNTTWIVAEDSEMRCREWRRCTR